MLDFSQFSSEGHEFMDCKDFARWEVQPKGRYVSPTGYVAPYSAETSVAIDYGSELIYFLSRGPPSTGTIEFDCDRDEDAMDVTITVQAYYSSPEVLKHSYVCILERFEVQNGIGIFVRPPSRMFVAKSLTYVVQTRPHLGSSVEGMFISFHILVTVPERYNDLPIQLDTLLVKMPLFSVTFSETMYEVHCRSIHLETASMPICIKVHLQSPRSCVADFDKSISQCQQGQEQS